MRVRAIWPILLLLSCDEPAGKGDPTDDTEDTTPDDTDVVETDGADTDPPENQPPSVTGSFGNVLVMHNNPGLGDPPRTKVRAMFLQTTTDVASVAACVIHDRYCMSELPTEYDTFVDIVDADFSALPREWIDVGETITLGGNTLTKYLRGDGSTWFYQVDLPSYPAAELTSWPASLAGEYGQFTGDIVDLPAPITVLGPDIRGTITFRPGDVVDFTWTPTGEGDMFLMVDMPPVTRRVYRLEDTGQYRVVASELGDVTQQATGVVELFRLKERVSDWGGNTILGQTFSRQSWNASTVARSCKQLLLSNPALPSGTYTLQPDPAAEPRQVWCDMQTDGGGWTLVTSSVGAPDDTSSPYNANIASTNPGSLMNGVWDGMRTMLPGNRSDIRFTCKVRGGAANFDVDLSFYDNVWYAEMADSASDAASCFNEQDGVGADPPPARRDNIANNALPAGNQWNYGYLEGEDSCSDNGDFTVDFDDRGMDNNQNDGTDWGEDDGTMKCGVTNGAEFFIFMREP